MKLGEFLQDTMSPAKGSAVKVPLKGIIESYRDRYDALKKTSAFRHDIYTVLPHKRKIVHIKVPSETVTNFYYDVMLELDIPKGCTDFKSCDLKIFSNCPSFVYSHAYVFAHWDVEARKVTTSGKGMLISAFRSKLPRDRMLIPGTEKPLGKQPIHDPPVVRNPLGIPMFDKSIYFAIFYLMEELTPDDILRSHNHRSEQQVVASITPFDSLMVQRKRAENKQRAAAEKTAAKRNRVFAKHEQKLAQANTPGVKVPSQMKRVVPITSKKSTKGPSTTSNMKSTRRS